MRHTCTCADPVPVERAIRKGVAQTICIRCGQPMALRLVSSRRAD